MTKLVPKKWAAAAIGVSASTVVDWERSRRCDWISGRPSFRVEVQKAKAVGIAAKMETIEKAADAAPQNWTAAAWLLERTCPGDFGRNDRRTPEARRIDIHVHDSALKELRQQPQAILRDLRDLMREARKAEPVRVLEGVKVLDAPREDNPQDTGNKEDSEK